MPTAIVKTCFADEILTYTPHDCDENRTQLRDAKLYTLIGRSGDKRPRELVKPLKKAIVPGFETDRD